MPHGNGCMHFKRSMISVSLDDTRQGHTPRPPVVEVKHQVHRDQVHRDLTHQQPAVDHEQQLEPRSLDDALVDRYSKMEGKT